ncbi:MAG TPA: hypothetical protein VFT29_01040 [Gemmatimonadaceae bacterium]|nr:hypothetical protein [Gemmatimonadaceae bacterium]
MDLRTRQRWFTRWLVTIGACLAIVAQLSVAFASVAEARDGQGMGAHVEQSGTSLHYAHSDICALCQVRSLTGLVMRAPEPFVPSHVAAPAVVAVAERVIVADLSSPSTPRAPPSAR